MMKQIIIYLSIFFILGLFQVNFQSCSDIKEDNNTQKVYLESIKYAQEKNVKLILVFGADWCKDCRSLKDRFFNSQKISLILNSNFIVYNVDVGDFDKNLEFAKNFGSPQQKGIPALVIIDPSQNNKILDITNAGEFASASTMTDEAIENYLKRFNK